VTVNYQTAMDWYRKAAEGGYAPAELSIGIMYMAGRGTPKDPQQAAEWFRRAAEHGLPDAQVQLAGDTLSGIATADGKPDKVEALKWLLLGADAVADPLMKQVAITQRAALEGQMTAEERGESQKRADAWRKQHAPRE
jgi:TPR repeat protein